MGKGMNFSEQVQNYCPNLPIWKKSVIFMIILQILRICKKIDLIKCTRQNKMNIFLQLKFFWGFYFKKKKDLINLRIILEKRDPLLKIPNCSYYWSKHMLYIRPLSFFPAHQVLICRFDVFWFKMTIYTRMWIWHKSILTRNCSNIISEYLSQYKYVHLILLMHS